MAYKLRDLIDLKHFQNLQDSLNRVNALPSSIIDTDGNVLTATAWQDICVKFHRKSEECERECNKSNRYILAHVKEANPAVSYQCPHGLVDNAVPIVIDGVHYGIFFTGQLFLEEPDLGFFRAQAKKYGFEESDYIEAVKRVPIWTRKQLDNYLLFIKGLTALIAESGLKRLKEIENRKEIEERKKYHQSILKTATDGFILADSRGRVTEVNDAYCSMSGYREDELLSMHISDLEAAENPQQVASHIQKISLRGSDRFESRHKRKDGSVFDVEISVDSRPDAQRRFVSFVRDISDRKRIEKTLIESNAMMSSVFSAAPVGIGVVVDRVFQSVNDRFCEMTGYSMKELIGQRARIVYPDDETYESVGRENFKQIKKRGTGSVDTKFRRKNGKIIDVLLSAAPIYSKDLSMGFTFTALDIAGRKQAERDLIESESKIRSIIETAMDGFVRVDIDGNILEANQTYCRMSGYSEEELLGMTAADVEATLTPAEVMVNLRRVIDMGQVRFESSHRRKDGSVFDVEGSIQYQRTDGGCLVIFIRDITEQKRNEKYNRMLVEMLDEAPNSITIHDNDGRFLYANRKSFEIHGYEKREFMELNLHHLDVPESEVLIEERINKISEEGEAVFVAEHYRKDGSMIPLNVFVKSVEWEGKPAFLSIATDISETRRAEAEKERLEAQLSQAQKMEAVGRLAGGVAHDFNNMLSLILGHAEFALEEIEPSDPLYASIEEMKKAGERSAELTRQLLAFARKQTITPIKLDLNNILEGMLKMLQRLIGEDIALNWMPGSDLWPVKLDPGQIDQILANLCVNARDAIANVGNITIETKNVTIDESYSRNRAGLLPGDYVQIAVSDNGCGMDAETLKNIFEPFFTTKGIGKGTGLGLSTVYGIVKQNRGFIDVSSDPGGGTTFRVYLPKYEIDAIDMPGKVEKKAVKQGHETILIVEDEPAILAMTKTMLIKMGYTVLTAKTPGEAIRMALEYEGNIDLLLTDVVMPEMNGRDLAKEILSLYPNLKRIFMSGYTADVIAHHGVLEKGVNFVQKPYSRKDLGAKVREVLDGG